MTQRGAANRDSLTSVQICDYARLVSIDLGEMFGELYENWTIERAHEYASQKKPETPRAIILEAIRWRLAEIADFERRLVAFYEQARKDTNLDKDRGNPMNLSRGSGGLPE